MSDSVRALKLLGLAAGLVLALASPASAAPTVSVFPSPGTRYAEPATQISFRGIPASSIGTIKVTGSRSGVHAGRIAPHSDGQGGSYLSTTGFRAGETVTVNTSLNVLGGKNGTFSFRVAIPAGAVPPMQLLMAPAGSNGVQRFHSRPDLTPGSVSVTSRSSRAANGDIFVAPQAGPLQNGPMLLDPAGKLLWFRPVPRNQSATDFRVQTLNGQPVLTWWQGSSNNGSGRGEDLIFDQSYKQIAVVKAANGLQGADLHEFLVTPQGQAYIVAVFPIRWPGTPKPLEDSVVQEIDIKTGLVMFEWHAVDHVPIGESFFKTPHHPGHVWDPFHLNSVALDNDGNLIVSLRNTWAAYKIDHRSGGVIWTLGSNRSTFKLGSGVATAFQHNLVVQPDGTFTIFDDGAGPPAAHSQSRAIRVAVNTKTRTANLVSAFNHSPPLLANFEGGVQLLPGGDEFVGYGQQPYFTEFDRTGHTVFDAHFTAPTDNYRAYRFAWNGLPSTQPALALSRGGNGVSTLYASWNGATNVASWRLLSGASPTALSAMATVAKSNFETPISVHSEASYFAVQALSSSGRVLATSKTVGSSAPRLSLFGSKVFARGGFGGIPVGCFSAQACKVSATITTGRTVIARTGSETVKANSGGSVFFALSGTGRSLLARASGHQLDVNVALRSTDGAATSANVTLASFGASGRPPATSLKPAGSIAILDRTAFVNHAGVGSLFVSCPSQNACQAVTTVKSGNTVLAKTGAEFVGAQDLGLVFFKLSGAALAQLNRTHGNQLPVQVAVVNGSDVASGQITLTRF